MTPSSIEPVSPESACAGVYESPQIEHGHATLTVRAALAAERFPLSSDARTRRFVVGAPCTVQL